MERAHDEISDEKLEQIIRDRLNNNPLYYLSFLKKLIDEMDEDIPDDIFFELLQPSLSAYKHKNESGTSNSAKVDDTGHEDGAPLPSPEGVDLFFRPAVRKKLYDWQCAFFDNNLSYDERKKALNNIKKIFYSLTIESEFAPGLPEEDKDRNIPDIGGQIVQETADRTLTKSKSVFSVSKSVIFLCIIAIAIASVVIFVLFIDKSYRPSVRSHSTVMQAQGSADQKTVGIQLKEATVRQQQEKRENGYSSAASQEAKQITDSKQIRTIQQAAGPQNLQTDQANKKSRRMQKTEENAQAHTLSTTGRYSIQIGTFKTSSNARALVARLKKKGYKAYMITRKTNKNEKLFSVLVGKFSTLEDAHFVSAKIKNTEGLHAFVTDVTNNE